MIEDGRWIGDQLRLYWSLSARSDLAMVRSGFSLPGREPYSIFDICRSFRSCLYYIYYDFRFSGLGVRSTYDAQSVWREDAVL